MSRRNGSVSRAIEAASKNRLHMDRNPQHSRITDPSNPAGRRKEIDNVMKRARQSSPGSWDRKLLEVEEKDPNRWRHSGYKQLYLDNSRSPSPKRSRSPLPSRRSRSPVVRRTPPPRRTPRRSPKRTTRRSPVKRASPPPRRRTPPPRARTPPRRARPPSPPPPARSQPQPSSGSGSSASSCSDESCSVCSAKNKKTTTQAKGAKPRTRSPSPARKRASAPAPPTRELLKAREASKRSREEKVLEWQRSQLAVSPRQPAPVPIPPTHIKREGERRPAPPTDPREKRRKERGVSPSVVHAALADDDSSGETSSVSDVQPQRMTLSERFGKMAQWSADRSARLENMRITRRDATLHVKIDKDPNAPEPEAELEAAPLHPGMDDITSYPEELLSAAPVDMPSWDDVGIRYEYYKKRGYLRGLTLNDYMKWEQWWYKYQEWLKREQAYERWAEGESLPVRHKPRKRGGRHRRS